MANPSQRDTRGLSQLAELAERFAFSLLTGGQCGEPGQRSVSLPQETHGPLTLSFLQDVGRFSGNAEYVGKRRKTFESKSQ